MRKTSMNRAYLASLALCAAIATDPSSGFAQSPIGAAQRTDPDVIGVLGARRALIRQGTSVHQNETVETSAAGRTLLQFRDSTSLQVGPGAAVKLDRFVFNGDASAREAVLNMTRGSFRFVTGASNPRAFTLQTPHATIGIRGTVVEITIDGGETRINLLQGEINICPRLNAQRSCVVAGAGEFASVGRSGFIVTPGGRGVGPRLDGSPNNDPGGGGGGGGGGGRTR